jgi:hypothetical protein
MFCCMALLGIIVLDPFVTLFLLALRLSGHCISFSFSFPFPSASHSTTYHVFPALSQPSPQDPNAWLGTSLQSRIGIMLWQGYREPMRDSYAMESMGRRTEDYSTAGWRGRWPDLHRSPFYRWEVEFELVLTPGRHNLDAICIFRSMSYAYCTSTTIQYVL